jgi:hypothetical protein
MGAGTREWVGMMVLAAGSEMQQTGFISVEAQDLSEGFKNTCTSVFMHVVRNHCMHTTDLVIEN